MKKIISIILSLAMIAALAVPAMATENENESYQIFSVNSNSQFLQSDSESTYELKTEDYANGDACIYMIRDGSIVEKTYVDRSTGTVTTSDGNNNIISQKVCNVKSEANINLNASSETYKNAGTITYRYYIQGMAAGTRNISLKYYSTLFNTPSYRPQGKYASITELAGILVTALGLPGAIAGAAANWILVAAGVSVTATNFIISNGSYVSAHGTLMKWQASGNRTIYIEGTKYAFSDSNGNGTTEYDGDYYAYSNYTSHNSNFANLFYERMWGNDVFDIVSWS